MATGVLAVELAEFIETSIDAILTESAIESGVYNPENKYCRVFSVVNRIPKIF